MSENSVRALIDLPAERFEGFAARRRGFAVERFCAGRRREHTRVCAIRVQAVAGGSYEVFPVAGRAFADVRHANGFIHLGAEPAENALCQIEPGDALVIELFVIDRAGRANRGTGARVFPIRPINLGTSTRAAGNFGRRGRVARRDDASAQAFAKDVKHVTGS